MNIKLTAAVISCAFFGIMLAGCQSTQPTHSASPSAGCTTPTVIGLRGSGQTFGGDTSFAGSMELESFADGVQRTLGVNVRRVNIDYTAASVPTRLANAAELADYAKSVEAGATTLISTLGTTVSECASGSVYIVGYSQGAWAARVGLNRLTTEAERGNAAAKRALAQTRGLGLIGDPLRSSTSGVIQLGGASDTGQGLAVNAATAFTYALEQANVSIAKDLFSTRMPLSARLVIELCASGDIVCDASTLNTAALHQGTRQHRDAYTRDEPKSLAYQLGVAVAS